MKKKKTLSLFCTATLALSAFGQTVTAANEKYNDFDYVVDLDSIQITKYNGNSKIVTIPSEIDGQTVTSIGEEAFKENEKITKVNLPDTVEFIYSEAFADCSALKSVSIPEGLIKIYKDAFSGCSALETINLPKSLTEISSGAFCNCSSLESITIPQNVTNINSSAFSGCTSLAQIKVNYKNTSYVTIKSVLFSKDKKTLVCYPGAKTETTYTVPSYVEEISFNAFDSSKNLTEIKVSASNMIYFEIDGILFKKLDTDNISVDNSESKSGLYDGGIALIECPKGKSGELTIPDPGQWFAIHQGAFNDCTLLTKIKIPVNAKPMDNESQQYFAGSFIGCSSLEAIELSEEDNTYYDISCRNGVLFDKDKTTLVCYPPAKSNTSYKIPDTVALISSHAFSGCTLLTYIVIQETTDDFRETYINSEAFSGCTALRKIAIPATISDYTLYSDRFSDCTALKYVVFSGTKEQWENMSANCFCDDSELKNVKVTFKK